MIASFLASQTAIGAGLSVNTCERELVAKSTKVSSMQKRDPV
jgi:hypothetical protein